jgi:hypothetical protein
VAKQKDKKAGKKAYKQSSAYLKKGPKKPEGKKK